MKHLRSFLAFCAVVALAACDPVHSDEVSALGGEAEGVPRGPLHRPGQPCTVCHDGALGDPPGFTIAGTVYQRPSDTTGLVNVTVNMLDKAGSCFSTTTNAAGNFYVTSRQWTPTYPIVRTTAGGSGTCAPCAAGAGGRCVQMFSEIGWSGSCSSCHTQTSGPSSPGRVTLALDDGGTPP